MPSLMAMLGLDISRFQAGINQGIGAAKTGGENIGGALSHGIKGAIEGFAGLEALKKTLEFAMEEGSKAKEIDFGAERLGVTTKRFQELQHAADKSNSSIEAIYTAFKKLAAGSIEAEDGDSGMVAAFKTLGITVDELKAKTPEQIFSSIAENMEHTKIGGEQVAALLKTMGRSADELLPGLKRGMFNEANPFGRSDEEIKAAENFKKDVGVLKEGWEWVKRQVLSPEANKGGLISKLLHLEAESARQLFGIQKKTQEGPGTPNDLKATTKAEIEAEKKKQKDEEKHEEKIRKLKEELIRKQSEAQIAAMSAQERLRDLDQARAQILEAMNKSQTEEGRLNAALDIADIDKKRVDAAKEIESQNRKTTGKEFERNNLQKIGAYSSANDPALDISKKSEEHLREIRKLLTDSQKKGAMGGVNFGG